MSANAPNAVRKMYLSMELIVPSIPVGPGRPWRAGSRADASAPIHRPIKWLSQGNALKNLILWLFGQHHSSPAGAPRERLCRCRAILPFLRATPLPNDYRLVLVSPAWGRCCKGTHACQSAPVRADRMGLRNLGTWRMF